MKEINKKITVTNNKHLYKDIKTFSKKVAYYCYIKKCHLENDWSIKRSLELHLRHPTVTGV